MRAIRRLRVRPVLPASLAGLGELALNLRWSWHRPTTALFESIDAARWARVRQDPVAMLSATPPEDLRALGEDAEFVGRVEAALADLHGYLEGPRWYQREVVGRLGDDAPSAIAYFSPEFGITAALPQYSGGLGILAGDHLKSASDLGVPIVGVGLFYTSGYFRQSLDGAGWQQEDYPLLDPDNLPLSLLREEDGTPCLITLAMPGGATLHARVWRAQVGRVPLLLLDSDVEANEPALRELTHRLYGGGGDQRLQQEMLLGIGGVRALRLWSRLTGAPTPAVCHSNEGHAGFLGIERISELVSGGDLGFDEALQAVRAATVFTTHTPVPAGIDRFGVDQITRYFSGPAQIDGVEVERLLALGAEDYVGGDPQVFNMAVMGLRLGQRANGVSELHGQVSRGMFAGLWPGLEEDEVPIGSITNGVHASTWVDPRVVDLARSVPGGEDVDIEGDADAVWQRAASVPGDRLWATKRTLRTQLVDYARTRLASSMAKRGADGAELGWVSGVLDPDALTIGFARRVPTYKRLTLMLRDPERLTRLLTDPERPVQIVVAGKSHPADDTGKRLIQDLVRFTDDPRVRDRIVFLPNYDIDMAQHLFPGCDVWLNNPLRPFEACGTSGMKAALNGALNVSILDGWWDEWFDGNNGWAIPTADGATDAERRDDLEAAALYDLLESRVVPTFYDRDEDGLPQRWLGMISHTLGTLGPKVMASRMVRDYTESLYLPAAAAGRAVAAEDFAGARDLAAFTARVRAAWPGVRVDRVDATGVSDSPQVGETLHVNASVDLGGLSPDDVTVQLVLGRASDSDELTDLDTHDLTVASSDAGESAEGHDGLVRFAADVELARTGSLGWTVRILPQHERYATPAESGLVRTP